MNFTLKTTSQESYTIQPADQCDKLKLRELDPATIHHEESNQQHGRADKSDVTSVNKATNDTKVGNPVIHRTISVVE